MPDDTAPDLLTLTTEIVAAHISKNHVLAEGLPVLITEVYRALSTAGSAVETAPQDLTPAVPIKKSVFPDYIICLEDGKKLKMLKRHLSASYSMTPDEYRTRWGLDRDYPMVAPSYAQKRSELAKVIGLGRKPGGLAAEAAPEVTKVPARRAKGSRG